MKKVILIALLFIALKAHSQGGTYTLANKPINLGWADNSGVTYVRGQLYIRSLTTGLSTDSVLVVLNGQVRKVSISDIATISRITGLQDSLTNKYSKSDANARFLTYSGALGDVDLGSNNIFVNLINGMRVVDQVSGFDISGGATNTYTQFIRGTGTLSGTNSGDETSASIITKLGYTPNSGAGTSSYLVKYTGSNTQGNSIIEESSSKIGVGITPDSKFHVGLSNGAQFRIDFNGLGENYYDGVNHNFRGSGGIGDILILTSSGATFSPTVTAPSIVVSSTPTTATANYDLLVRDNSGGVDDGKLKVIAASSSLPSQLKDWYTDASNIGSSGTDLYTFNVPANTLTADGQKIAFSFGGIVANNSNSKTLTIGFGNSSFSPAASTQFGGSWYISGFLIRTSSTTYRIVFNIGNRDFWGANASSSGTVTNYTSVNTFALSATGVATDDITAKLGTLQFLPAAP